MAITPEEYRAACREKLRELDAEAAEESGLADGEAFRAAWREMSKERDDSPVGRWIVDCTGGSWLLFEFGDDGHRRKNVRVGDGPVTIKEPPHPLQGVSVEGFVYDDCPALHWVMGEDGGLYLVADEGNDGEVVEAALGEAVRPWLDAGNAEWQQREANGEARYDDKFGWILLDDPEAPDPPDRDLEEARAAVRKWIVEPGNLLGTPPAAEGESVSKARSLYHRIAGMEQRRREAGEGVAIEERELDRRIKEMNDWLRKEEPTTCAVAAPSQSQAPASSETSSPSPPPAEISESQLEAVVGLLTDEFGMREDRAVTIGRAVLELLQSLRGRE